MARVVFLLAALSLVAVADAAAQSTPCRFTYGLTPILLHNGTYPARLVGSAGGSVSFVMDTEIVDGPGPCRWGVSTDGDPVFSGLAASLTGDATLDVRIAANGSSPRTGRITVLFGSGFYEEYDVVQAGAIRCGETRTGSYVSNGPVPAFDFVVNAGDVVMLRGVERLYGPDGTLIDDNTSVGEWSEPETYGFGTAGVYTAVAFVRSNSTYTLGLQFVRGGACATSIACGSSRTGTLASASQIDVYRFAAVAGERIVMAQTISSGGVELTRRRLFDPDGQMVASYTSPATPGYLTYDLAKTGSYSVTAYALRSEGLGSYDVFVQFLGTRCATSLTCGQLLTSTKPVDVYAISATAGRSIGVFVPSTPGSPFGREAELLAADGSMVSRIGNTRFGSERGGHYLPATTGTYLAVVTTSETGGDRRVGLACQGICDYFLESNAKSFTAEGGGGDTVVYSGVTPLDSFAPDSSCCWTSESHVPWIRFTSGASACRTWAPAYAVDPFTGGGRRTGTLTIAGQTYTVTQTGIPLQPTGLTGSVTGSRVTLSWTRPVESIAVTYVIDVGSMPGASDVATAATGSAATSFVVDSVPPGTYYIRVRAQGSVGTGLPSNEITVNVTGPAAPGAPLQLTASVDGSAVTLAWLAPTSGGVATAYRIEGGTASGVVAVAISLGDARTTYVASGLPAGSYFARVRAMNSVGTGPPSNEVSFTVQPSGCTAAPAAPGTLAHTINSGVVMLTWTAPAPTNGPTQYRIEVGSSARLANLVVFDTPSAATTFSAVAPPGTYYVRVRALNACGVSSPTSDLTVVVQ